MNIENIPIKKRMISLGITGKALSKEIGISINTFSHWICSPMTESHKKMVIEALDRIEAERKNNGRN